MGKKKLKNLRRGSIQLGQTELSELRKKDYTICGWLRSSKDHNLIIYNPGKNTVSGTCALKKKISSPCDSPQLPQVYGCCPVFVENFPEAARLNFLRMRASGQYVNPSIIPKRSPVFYSFDQIPRDLFPETRPEQNLEANLTEPIVSQVYDDLIVSINDVYVNRITPSQRTFLTYTKIPKPRPKPSFVFGTFEQLHNHYNSLQLTA